MARFGRSRPLAVLPLGELAAPSGRRDTQQGALARSLSAVARLGVEVPATFVIVADVFRHVVQTALPPGHDPASLLRTVHRPAGIERAARARERMLTVGLSPEVEREIDRAWRSLIESSPWGVAVRSSALLADQGVARAAGLAGTELPVFTRDELGAKIRRIWAAAASESTLTYLRARRARDVAVAVVLQPVVASRATVTLLTEAPATLGAPPEAKLDRELRRAAIAVHGLASRSSDLGLAEVVTFDAAGNVTSRRPSTQETRSVVRDRCLCTVDAEDGDIVTDARLSELAEVARRLETLGGSVVELVIPEEGDAKIVDVTPTAHLGFPGTGTGQTLWSRAASSEAPAEPLTPLSRHLLTKPLLERARRVFTERRRAGRAGSVLTTIDGRPYINLSPVLETESPGDLTDPISRIELAGAQWTTALDREPSFRPSLARAGLRIAQLATEQRALTDEVTRFERNAEQQRRWLAEMDLAILPDDSLTTTLHEVSGFLSRSHELHARASAAALSGHALLASVIGGAEKVHGSWFAHTLAAGADVVTARPAAAFCHVAAIARFDDAARDALAGGAATPEALPDGPLRRAFRQFLQAYGDRAIAEVELGAPRWAEDPRPIVRMLSASLRADAVDPDVASSRARALADRRLALLEPHLSFFETRVVRDIVSRQRELLRLRERCRTRVAHGLSMMRVVALDVDRRIRRLDPSLEAGAALLLGLDELAGAVSKYRADLAPIVRARRADLDRERRSSGPPAVFRGAPSQEYPSALPSVLRGLRASPGTGEGKVVRLTGACDGLERFTTGDVLVVRSLDLGLAPLFMHAGGIVTELGTPFASSSVVARDCGVPVVTGVPSAFVLLRDGERVRVDGDSGTVERAGV